MATNDRIFMHARFHVHMGVKAPPRYCACFVTVQKGLMLPSERVFCALDLFVVSLFGFCVSVCV